MLSVDEVFSFKTKMLQIYRHGNRSLVVPYKNDPYNSEKFWPNGLYGQLTNVCVQFSRNFVSILAKITLILSDLQTGKQYQYLLGQYFRRRYQKLIGVYYSSDTVSIQSSRYDRSMQVNRCNCNSVSIMIGILICFSLHFRVHCAMRLGCSQRVVIKYGIRQRAGNRFQSKCFHLINKIYYNRRSLIASNLQNYS